MARIINEEDYAARRNEILDAMQRLVYTKGYEQITIQDLLHELQISKGAFYHYFRSKHTLLEALIERLLEEAIRFLTPILSDLQLTAIEKLHRYFDSVASWKSAQKTYLMALLRVWYADDNTITRQKIQTASIEQITPLLVEVIRQGIQEGTLAPAHPEQAGEVILCLLQGMGESIARLMLKDQPQHSDLEYMAAISTAYNDAIERVLGAASHSIHIFDPQILQEWIKVEE